MSTQITASCQCGQLVVTSTVAQDKLPLDVYFCSCSICRYLSGTLAISSVNLHHAIDVRGQVSRYATSTGPRGLDRCFCPTCGTLVYEDCPDVSRIGLFGGAMDRAAELVKLKGTIYASSTRDGGMASWIPEYPAFVGEFTGDDVRRVDVASLVSSVGEKGGSGEMLPCSCLCGEVRFQITRPNEASYDLSAKYSDSLVPFSAGDEHLNPKDEKWWICDNGTKYAAAVCACTSCRKSSGQDLVQWAFVPAVNIVDAEGKPYGLHSTALQSYKSSEGVTRYFCRSCGANVFWTSEDRFQLIDVAVGLMRSKAGSRAEDWLEWLMDRISFVEDAQNKELVDAVQAGMKKWHKTRKA